MRMRSGTLVSFGTAIWIVIMEDRQITTAPRAKPWYQRITVEPIACLDGLALTLSSVVEQVFFVYKACTVNHGYAHDVCVDIEHHEDVKKAVQVTVSTFLMWNSVAMFAVPIVLSLFLGAWSDRRGRKLPLIVGLVGRLIFALMLTVNTRMRSWPLEYVIFTATLPSSLLGSEIAIHGSCVAYLTDISTAANRTIRLTIFSGLTLIAMPIGVSLGSVIYNGSVRSFAIVFLSSALLLLTAAIYATLRLKSRTTDRQSLIGELPWYRIPMDFFDCNHIVTSMQIFFKKRPQNGRVLLYMMMVIVGFFALQMSEGPILFLYTQLKFNWDAHMYSYFQIFSLTGTAIVQFAGVPLLIKVLKMKDSFIIMIASVTAALGYVVMIFAQQGWLMFAALLFEFWSPMTMPVGLSMISRMIHSSERGVIFSLLYSLKIILRLVGGTLYTLVYNASIDVYPQAFAWLSIGNKVLSLVLIIYVHAALQRRSINKETQEESSNGQVQRVGYGVLPESSDQAQQS